MQLHDLQWLQSAGLRNSHKCRDRSQIYSQAFCLHLTNFGSAFGRGNVKNRDLNTIQQHQNFIGIYKSERVKRHVQGYDGSSIAIYSKNPSTLPKFTLFLTSSSPYHHDEVPPLYRPSPGPGQTNRWRNFDHKGWRPQGESCLATLGQLLCPALSGQQTGGRTHDHAWTWMWRSC